MPVLPGIAVDAEIGTSDKAAQEDVGEGYAFHVQADTAAVTTFQRGYAFSTVRSEIIGQRIDVLGA